MHRGAYRRFFFFLQANNFICAHQSNLPESLTSIEEEEAGFPQLYKAFGFLVTLKHMSKELVTPQKELLKWSVRDFYTQVLLSSWQADCEKKYQEIISRSK